MNALNCLFLVQGEGRGHLTQALALRGLLEDAGHRVAGVLVGRSRLRDVPAYFLDEIGAPVAFLDSPNFVTGAARRGIRWGPTLARGLRRLPHYRRSLAAIDAEVRRRRPDVIVNFFEPLGGLYAAWYRPAVPIVSIAHQNVYLHPAHRFPAGHRVARAGLLAFTRLAAFGAARRLALALEPLPEAPGVVVMPPLLRAALFAQPPGVTEDFLLIYLLNHGYADDVRRWHARHPEQPLHVFWDHPEAAPIERVDATLTFHRLDGERFLALMARCRGLVTTAGFESVAEAMTLGKPVLAVPVEGHFEQFCNSLDAEAAGAGLAARSYDIDALLDFLPRYESPARRFRAWLAEGGARAIREIEATAGVPTPADGATLEPAGA